MNLFYCPHCWNMISEDARVCAYCLRTLTDWLDPVVVDCLITALRGQKRARTVFAAQMLGRYQVVRAITPMREVLEITNDPYIKHVVREALLEMKDES